MEKNEIDFYIQNILKKQLQKLRLSSYGLYSILDNVKMQLNSIIKHWTDEEFINTIFLTTTEEGTFYEPIVNNKIGNLVVLAVRNSLIETLASVDYKSFGLKNVISDETTKTITSEAIKYFKDIDLEKLSLSITIEDDYYNDIIKKYNTAYKVLSILNKCTEKTPEIEFSPFKCEVYNIEEISSKEALVNKRVKETMSGISEEIKAGLGLYLKGIEEGKSSFFYVDSFKYVSRNFAKNMRILEFVLTHDAIFLTNNFFISNGYVSRRKKLIRASHGDNFNTKAINSIGEISKKYQKNLERMFQVENDVE